MKWEVPEEFFKVSGFDQEAVTQAENSEKAVNPKELANHVKLIGALYDIIIQKGLYRTDDELKAYLEAEYDHLGGFSRRTLDSRISAAKKAIHFKDWRTAIAVQFAAIAMIFRQERFKVTPCTNRGAVTHMENLRCLLKQLYQNQNYYPMMGVVDGLNFQNFPLSAEKPLGA